MAYQHNILNNIYGQSAQYNLNPYNKEMSTRDTASHISISSLPVKFSYGNHTSIPINGDMYRTTNPTGNIKQVQFGIKDPENYNKGLYSGGGSSFGLSVETCIESGTRGGVSTSLQSSNSPNKTPIYRMPEIVKAESHIYSTHSSKINSVGNIYNGMYQDMKVSPRQGIELPNNQMKQYIINSQPIYNNEMKQNVSVDINKNIFFSAPRTHEEAKTGAPFNVKTKRFSEGMQITRNSSKVLNKVCAKNSSTFKNSELLKHSQSIKKLKYKMKTKSGKLFYEPTDENESFQHKKYQINENDNNNNNNVITNNNVSNVQDYRIKREDNLNKERDSKKNDETKEKYILEELHTLSNKYTEKLGRNLNNPVKEENKYIKSSIKKNFEQTRDVMISKKEELKNSNITKDALLINTKETKTTCQNLESSKKELPNISLPSINENIIDENGGLTLFEKFIIVDKYDGIKQWNGFEWERITNDYMFFLKVKYDRKGHIWCINDSHETLKIVDGKIKNLGFLGNEKMIDIGFDKNNVLWCVNIKGHLLKWNKTGWRKISYFGFHKLLSITFDLEGKLWAINSKKTLAVWNPNKKNWNEKYIKNNVKIVHMDFDKNGMIWALTTTNSLLSYYAGNWINHGLLHSNHIISFSCKRL